MSLFQDILKQVQERLTSQEHNLDLIAAHITTLTTVPVHTAQLRIQKGTLLIQVPPTLKLAIMTKKEAILQFCREHQIPVHTIS